MTESRGDALAMAQQVQSFLRDLERLGFTERAAVPDTATNRETTRPAASTTFEILQSLAHHFGYRLA